MCGPAALAVTAIAASVVGGVTQARGAQQQASAQAASANYSAQVADNNAIIAKYQAQDAVRRGDIAAATSGQRTAALIAKQRVAGGSSGFDVNSGSPEWLQVDAAGSGRLDALTTRYNAQTEARQGAASASSFTAQAGLDRMTASNAGEAGDIGVLSATVGTVGSVANQWYTYNRPVRGEY